MTMADDRRLRASVARQHALVGTLASPCVLSGRLLDRAARSVHRLVVAHASIIPLIEALYYGTLLDLDDRARGQKLPGFLFDMNSFWQRLLDRFLREFPVQSACFELLGIWLTAGLAQRELRNSAPAQACGAHQDRLQSPWRPTDEDLPSSRGSEEGASTFDSVSAARVARA